MQKQTKALTRPWIRSAAAKGKCDAAGQGRSHGYPPPKKFPDGGKAAIGLTRLPRNLAKDPRQ